MYDTQSRDARILKGVSISDIRKVLNILPRDEFLDSQLYILLLLLLLLLLIYGCFYILKSKNKRENVKTQFKIYYAKGIN